jgi:3-isopropylmalate/(R)-2-methylmalate dehydratase small subunit
MRVWKFGDNIDTDAIIPGRYLVHNDPKVLASHAFEGTRDDFAREVREGDIVIAGRNFGCGSSREHAPLALLGAGVTMVIAESFARIFYRNAVNVGILPLVCREVSLIPDGADITVNIDGQHIDWDGQRLGIEPVPEFLKEIVDAGGLVAYGRDITEVSTCTGSRR